MTAVGDRIGRPVVDRAVASALLPLLVAATERRAGRLRGVVAVWCVELAKLVRLRRVQVAFGACLLSPFLAAAALRGQSSLPRDTLFGQWLHESGLALPLVVLGFTGQWVLPLLACLVAGDVFAAEDQFGTWKLILTRGRSRGELFVGKVLAATTYTALALGTLAVSSVTAGLLLSREPVVGLGGQLVPAGHAWELALASWASQLPPLLGFALLAVLLSVVTRSGALGIGGPVLLAMLMQLLALLSLPVGLHDALLTTPFSAWHGLWAERPFCGPLLRGLVVSAVWGAACLLAAWSTFRGRRIQAP